VRDRRLERIRRLVLAKKYRLSSHVLGGIESGEYCLEDVVRATVYGETCTSHRDEKGTAVDGHKYVVTGPDTQGRAFRTVGKIQEWSDGQEYFFIAAFEVTET